MCYVYVLQSLSVEDEWYIGFTNDLKRRFKEHNQKQSFSTKRYEPWKLVYYEACTNEIDARRREGYLKTSQGRRLLFRRLKEYRYEQKTL
jgi:putative endonuclease